MDIGGPIADRITVGSAHKGLSRQVEQDIRREGPDLVSQVVGVSNVDKGSRHARVELEAVIQAVTVFRRQSGSKNLGAAGHQQFAEPRALENPYVPVIRTFLPCQKLMATYQTFHGALPVCQSCSSWFFFTERVHGGPEAVMQVDTQLTVLGQPLQRLGFPGYAVAGNSGDHGGFADEESTIDPLAVTLGFFPETGDPVARDVQRAKPARWLNGRHGGLQTA